MSDTPLEAVLKRDRAIVATGLLVLAAFAWIYTISDARGMGEMGVPSTGTGETTMSSDAMSAVVMPMTEAWTPRQALMVFVMWAVMMVAMMVPSAAPMVLLFAALNRKKQEREMPYVPTSLFLAGYLVVWVAFSALVTLAQWGLQRAALLSPMMVSTSAIFGGAVLIAAGIFQWTPLKNACLYHCRSPLSFLTSHWRDNAAGAFRIGLHHGAYCVGCCWMLMLLLFVTGVMNLVWVTLIAAFVLAEKVVPAGVALAVSRSAGAAVVAWGIAVISGAAA